MKLLIRTFALGLLVGGIGLLAHAQDRTELCRSSGYHCMDVDYGGIKAKLVKGKNQPGAVIIEESDTK